VTSRIKTRRARGIQFVGVYRRANEAFADKPGLACQGLARQKLCRVFPIVGWALLLKSEALLALGLAKVKDLAIV
jgi:hypothetical protein